MGKYPHPPSAHRHPEPRRHQPHPLRDSRARTRGTVRGAREQPECSSRGERQPARPVRPRRSDGGALRALGRLDGKGRLGLFLREPHRRGQADPAAPCGHALHPGLLAGPRTPHRDPHRRLRSDAALFDLRPGGQHAAFVGFSLPTFFTGILFILLFSIQLDWLPFVYRADIAETGWAGGGRTSSSRSCRSRCWASLRLPRGRVSCARPCST